MCLSKAGSASVSSTCGRAPQDQPAAPPPPWPAGPARLLCKHSLFCCFPSFKNMRIESLAQVEGVCGALPVSWPQDTLTFPGFGENILKIPLRTRYPRTLPPWTSESRGATLRARSFRLLSPAAGSAGACFPNPRMDRLRPSASLFLPIGRECTNTSRGLGFSPAGSVSTLGSYRVMLCAFPIPSEF